jgi:hypothetical protein
VVLLNVLEKRNFGKLKKRRPQCCVGVWVGWALVVWVFVRFSLINWTPSS